MQTHSNNEPDPSTPFIDLEILTWFKENQGLFDYQADGRTLTQRRVVVHFNCKIYRHPKTHEVKVVKEDEEAPSMEHVYIATVLYNPLTRQYHIQSADVSGEQPHPYICQEQPEYYRNSHVAVAELEKDEGQEGYPLEVGSCLRLGKLEFEVIEMRDERGTRRAKETAHLQKNRGVYVVERDGLLRGACKFCLCEESQTTDPLIAPCNCRGSCAVVHMKCLQSWVNSKVRSEKEGQALIYNFSKFECEICCMLFPRAVRLPDHTEVALLDYTKATQPYVLLESTNKADPIDRVVYVLFPTAYEPVKLGRGHHCAVRMDDITVSRVHAEVRLSNGKFYIADMKSKFGTLVKFREEFVLRDKLKLQSSKVLLSFTLFPPQPSAARKPPKKETLRPDRHDKD